MHTQAEHIGLSWSKQAKQAGFSITAVAQVVDGLAWRHHQACWLLKGCLTPELLPDST
jgi:hypothetical protein